MSVEAWLDRAHLRISRSAWLVRATAGVRVLLSVGFLAPGLNKLLGDRFVSVVTDDAVGQFFEALYQTGLYWRFLGAGQVLAACLILSDRTAAAGSLLFFGITLNVFVITMSLPFGDTAIVAGLMLLASIYLVLWYFPRWKRLFFDAASAAPAAAPAAPSLCRRERIGFTALVLGGWGATCVMRGLLTTHYLIVFWGCLVLALAGAAAIVLSWTAMGVSRFRARRRSRASDPEIGATG
jgi:hypothetical protein